MSQATFTPLGQMDRQVADKAWLVLSLDSGSFCETCRLTHFLIAAICFCCSGAKVVVAGSAYGEMAMHFIEKYGMMALRLPSKFDMRRFCRYRPLPFGIL